MVGSAPFKIFANKKKENYKVMISSGLGIFI